MTHKLGSLRAATITLALFMLVVPGIFAGGDQEATEEQITIRIDEHPGDHVGPMEDHFIPL